MAPNSWSAVQYVTLACCFPAGRTWTTDTAGQSGNKVVSRDRIMTGWEARGRSGAVSAGWRRHGVGLVRIPHRTAASFPLAGSPSTQFNPLMGTVSYSAISNNMKLVYWPSMGGLLHLVQRGKDWAGRSSPRPLLAVQNVTAHPSTASVPITVLLYNGPLFCGFNVPTEGFTLSGLTKYPQQLHCSRLWSWWLIQTVSVGKVCLQMTEEE